MLTHIIRNMFGLYLFVLIHSSGVTLEIQHNIEYQENRVKNINKQKQSGA